jgi:hypothetical protein
LEGVEDHPIVAAGDFDGDDIGQVQGQEHRQGEQRERDRFGEERDEERTGHSGVEDQPGRRDGEHAREQTQDKNAETDYEA